MLGELVERLELYIPSWVERREERREERRALRRTLRRAFSIPEAMSITHGREDSNKVPEAVHTER
jgi:hypothetical protein